MTASGFSSWRWVRGVARRPAVATAGVFIGGIAAHSLLAHAPLAWIACAFVAALIGITSFRHPIASSSAVVAAVFFVAVAAAQIESLYFSLDDVGNFAADQPRLAYVELEFDQPLRIIGLAPDDSSARRPMPPRQVTNALVRRILTTSGWRDAAGRTLVQIEPPNQSLSIGQTVRALGMLQRPSPAMNPGQFDWAAYYREQRILASIQIPHSDAMRILKAKPPSLLASAREFVRRKLAAGFDRTRSLDRALLVALVLGDHDPEIQDVQEQFRRTGTSYLLAISGLHIAVLGALMYWLGHRLLLRPRVIIWIAMTAVVLYALLALPTATGVRSAILCVAFGFGKASRRAVDGVQLLALAVLMILIAHPLDLFNPGFQLGFATVLGLALFTHSLFEFLGGEPNPDERVAFMGIGQQRPDTLLTMWFHGRRALLRSSCPAIVAWAVSMPLMGYYFDQLNPWAIVAGLLMMPLVFIALIGGFVKILLTMLLPGLALWWARLAGAPVACTRTIVAWLAHVPGSDVPLPSKSISLLVVYYALLLLPLLPLVRPWLRRATRLGPAAAVLLLVLLSLSGGAVRLPDGSLRVTVLAIGAGQCAVVELPDGRAILIDAGSATLTEPVRKCIAPFLRTCGRGSIEEIWLSHGDFDHVSAAAELIHTYGVPRVVVSDAFESHSGGATDEAVLETIHDRHVALEHVHAGDRAALGKDVTLDVLWPPGDDPALTSNNAGLVLKLTYARRTIVFPADIQEPAELPLLRHPEQLRCDVLVAPHHGSSEATTAAFVAAADPLYIVSSNDRTLTQKQRVFEKLIGRRPLFRTNACGAVSIVIERNGGLTVTPFVPASSPDAATR